MKKILLVFALLFGVEGMVISGPAFSKEATAVAGEKGVGVFVIVGAVATLLVLHKYSLERRRKEAYLEYCRSQDQSIIVRTKVPFQVKK